MRIAIVNNMNVDHSIYRLSGEMVRIKNNDYVIIETDDDSSESNYWVMMSQNPNNKYGLKVYTDANSISRIIREYGDKDDNQNYVSPVDSFDPHAFSQPVKQSDSSPKSEYTEESLSNLSRDELISIIESKNIKYRKNNTVKTLIKLILESGSNDTC